MIELATANLLATEPSISCFVDDRVHLIKLPDNGKLPAIVLKDVGGNSFATMDTDGYQKLRLQVDCFAETAAKAYRVRSAVEEFLKGLDNEPLQHGLWLDWVEKIQPLGTWEQDLRGFGASAEFYLYFTTAAPAGE